MASPALTISDPLLKASNQIGSTQKAWRKHLTPPNPVILAGDTRCRTLVNRFFVVDRPKVFVLSSHISKWRHKRTQMSRPRHRPWQACSSSRYSSSQNSVWATEATIPLSLKSAKKLKSIKTKNGGSEDDFVARLMEAM
jgi:hypothetical protein